MRALAEEWERLEVYLRVLEGIEGEARRGFGRVLSSLQQSVIVEGGSR